jgi:carboxyl-terminal processing protease
MSRWNLIWLLGILGTYLIGFSVSLSAPQRDSDQKTKHENVRLIIDVLEEVDKKYVKELTVEKRRELVENMINGGLEKLDPHSQFINAEEYKHFTKQSRGKFGGVGIRVGVDRGGQLLVESPMPGTPAYEAGVLAGDLILKIDGVSTENMSLKKAVDMIQGDPGQKVILTVLHEGSRKPTDITISRAEILIESVLGDQRMDNNLKEWDFMIDRDSKIAYIRITSFTETTVEELTKVVDQLQKDGCKGLVLDLRTNPGGLLKAAIEVSELFLPPGTRIVSTKGRNEKEVSYESRKPAASKGGPYTSYPIAVLLNRFSASASEIVAGALQEAGRAVVVGERSYGKGSVQTVIPMEGSTSALKLTTAQYFVGIKERPVHRFPDSKEADAWGVKPSDGYEVKLSDEERVKFYRWRRLRDVVRKPGQPPPKVEENDKVESDFKDRVLEKAKEYIQSELNKRGEARPMPGRPQMPQAAVPAPVQELSRGPMGRAGLSNAPLLLRHEQSHRLAELFDDGIAEHRADRSVNHPVIER